MSKGPQSIKHGDIIAGRYRLDAVLGKGAMGVAYKATQLALKQSVVVKLIRPEYAADEEYRNRFQREARTCSRIQHPNVVKVFDFGIDDGLVFLVMEFLKGQPLRDALTEGKPLPWERTFAIARQLVSVLSTAHAIPLVHRDLKPENVMLERLPGAGEERAVVVDFGLAFVASEGGELGRLTASNVVLGTPQYLSPEQARGLEIGPPADIYALGCILFELFTGRTPFVSKKVLDMVTAHVYTPPPSARQFAPEVPPRVDELLQEMLRKKPEDRPNALELRARLQELYDEGQAPPTREDRALEKKQRLTPARGSSHAFLLGGRLGVAGPLDPRLEDALMREGFDLVPLRSFEAVKELEAILLPAPSAALVAALPKNVPPLVACAPANDPPLLAELLRKGALVLAAPLGAEALLAALRTAITKPLAVWGPLDEECEKALIAKHFVLTRVDGPPFPVEAELVFASAVAPEVLGALAGGPPVVVGVAAGDVARATELIRAGAASVVTLPVAPAELIEKLTQELRKRRRQKLARR